MSIFYKYKIKKTKTKNAILFKYKNIIYPTFYENAYIHTKYILNMPTFICNSKNRIIYVIYYTYITYKYM